jgi:hypothetical protein
MRSYRANWSCYRYTVPSPQVSDIRPIFLGYYGYPQLAGAAPAGRPGTAAEIAEAAVTAGGAFTLAPAHWPEPIPASVSWSPLIGHPIVRRTWAAWPAGSHRRDLGHFVAALDRPR